MMEVLTGLWEQGIELGTSYGVNPFVFAGIYIGAIPLFTVSIGWLVRRWRSGESIFLPTIVSSGFFLSAYIYAIMFGRNLPWWFYTVVIGWVIVGGYFTWKSARKTLFS